MIVENVGEGIYPQTFFRPRCIDEEVIKGLSTNATKRGGNGSNVAKPRQKGVKRETD